MTQSGFILSLIVLSEVVTGFLTDFHKSEKEAVNGPNTEFVNNLLSGVSGQNPYIVESSDMQKYAGYRDTNSLLLQANRFAFLDEYARHAPENLIGKNLNTLVEYLVKPAQNDLEKARVLFTWVATYLEYNYNPRLNDNYETPSVIAIIQGKTAICGGYACVLRELCLLAGLEAVKISGLNKKQLSPSSRTLVYIRHAWNAIRIDGKWCLFDVTWASTALKPSGNRNVKTSYTDIFWFDVDPEAFVFRHFPDTSKWQLLGENPVSIDQFKSFPYIPTEFFNLGFDGNKMLTAALSHDSFDFVKAYQRKCPVEVLSAPLNKYLRRDSVVNFTIRARNIKDMFLINDDNWIRLKKENDLFSIDYAPQGDTVRISVQICDSCLSNRILEYKVID
jgi:transglutaminase-like putative cysteine protease